MSTPIVLLISNNHDLRQLYHEILVSEHWEVINATNLTDALLQLIIHHAINLLILDMQFRHLELIRFLESLLTKSQWSSLSICFLDTDSDQSLPKSLLQRFSSTAFINPLQITPNQLVETLTKLR